MGKSILRVDEKLAKLQKNSKSRWQERNDGDIKFWVNKTKSVTTVNPIAQPKEHVDAIKIRPAFMKRDADKHFLSAMKHVGIEFFQYLQKKSGAGRPRKNEPVYKQKVKREIIVPDKVKKKMGRPAHPLEEKVVKILKHIVTIDPVTGKKKYTKKKRHPVEALVEDIKKSKFERPPAVYSNKNPYDDYLE